MNTPTFGCLRSQNESCISTGQESNPGPSGKTDNQTNALPTEPTVDDLTYKKAHFVNGHRSIYENYNQFSRELLLHNHTLISMEAVYIKSESSPRIRREENHLQNVARARVNRFSCKHFFVNSKRHLYFLLKTFLSHLRMH